MLVGELIIMCTTFFNICIHASSNILWETCAFMEVNKFVIHCMTLYHLYLYGMNVRQSLMTKYLLMSFILALPIWWVVWHDRRQVVNAPLALRQCYMSIHKSTGRHTRWQYLRYLVIRRQYGRPFAPLCGRLRNTSSVHCTSGNSLLGVWQRSTYFRA